MHLTHRSRLAALTFVLASATAPALEVQFDYRFDGGFFSGENESRRALLEAAAMEYESRFGDSLAAIQPSGNNAFDAVFTSPGTGTGVTLANFEVPADTLIVFAGARQLGSTLGVAGPGGFAAGGSQAFIDNVVSRGQAGIFEGPDANNFAPWGGAVAFDFDNDWYFDDDPSTLEPFPEQDDFYSVAIHELGHVFGFGTSDAFDANVDLDNAVFTGDAARAVFGDDVPLFVDPFTQRVDEGHFAEDIRSLNDEGVLQQPAMSPRLLEGTRKTLTQLDLASFEDVGFEQMAPVPIPAAWLLFASALGWLGWRRRRSAA